MTEVMSFEEMRRRYQGEWLLIAYTQLDDNLRVIAGEVLAHSHQRDDVYKALSLGHGRDVEIECFAEPQADMGFIL